MKTNNRFFKACAVILIVGITLIYNADYSAESYSQQDIATTHILNATGETATQEISINNLVSYSKTVIVTSIKQLINNR